MIKSYKNEFDELRHYISIIKQSTCPLHFTFCHLSDHVLIISKMVRELQKLIEYETLKTKIIDYLGAWQYNIVKELIESNRMSHPPYITIGKDNIFNFGSLFNRLNVYIHYFICSKDDKWLEETLISLYKDFDLKSVDMLYQYYILSYLNLDYVYLIDMCSVGFDGIRKMIRKKCNKCVINHSYELQMILKNYVDIPTTMNLIIEKGYHNFFIKFITKLNVILESKELSKHKEQSKRFKYVINNIFKKNKRQPKVKRFSSYKVWFYFFKYIFIKKEALFINYNSKICFFVSRYYMRNSYVKKQLANYNSYLIISYLDVLDCLANTMNSENYEKIANYILMLENFIISGISSIQLACTIIKYMQDIYSE